MLVYVAGAVDLADEVCTLDMVTDELNKAGVTVYKPWDGISPGRQLLASGPDIKRLNFHVLEACDGVLAVIGQTMSVGTVMDIDHARKRGKPVVVWLEEVIAPAYLFDHHVFTSLSLAIESLIERVVEDSAHEARTDVLQLDVALDDNARAPTRAHADDAGLDLYTYGDYTLDPYEVKDICTGTYVAIPSACFGLIMGRSSAFYRWKLNVKTAVIDPGWRGELKVGVENLNREIMEISEGQRIAQLLILPRIDVKVRVVERLQPGTREENGYGSTGQ
jgi:dUTP pyrophosphatase